MNEIELLRARVEELEAKMVYHPQLELVNERDAFKARVEELENRIEDLTELADNQSKLKVHFVKLHSQLCDERDAFKARVEELEVLWVENHLEDVWVLKKEREELRTQLEAAQAKLAKATEWRDKYKAEWDNSELRLRECERGNGKLEAKLATYEPKAQEQRDLPTVVETVTLRMDESDRNIIFQVHSDGTVKAVLEPV